VLRAVLGAPGFWGIALIGLGIIPSLYFATQDGRVFRLPARMTTPTAHPEEVR